MNKPRTLVLAALSVLALVPAATSQATTDSRVVSAVGVCGGTLNETQSTVGPGDDPLIHSEEGLKNRTGGIVLANCPITRENLTNTNGLRDLDVRVANALGVDQNFRCFAFSMRPDGSNIQIVQHTVTIPAFGAKNLDFNQAITMTAAYGSVILSCDMPHGTTLVNYLVREY